MVTMEDIADEVGCSVNTVSRAINNKPDVNPLTRMRVLEAAKRLGYVPNSLAQSLVTKNSRTIGVMVPFVSDRTYSALIQSIDDSIRGSGYGVFVAQSLEDPEIETEMVQLMYQKQVAGMIAVPFDDTPDSFGYFQRFDIPVVFAVNNIPQVKSGFVGPDLGRMVGDCVGRMGSNGDKKIMVLSRNCRSFNCRLREAFKTTMQLFGLEYSDARFIEISSLDEAYEAARAVLSAGSADSFIVTDDELALPLYRCMDEMGLKCPEQVRVIGCGNGDMCQYMPTPLSSVDLDITAIGRTSVEMLKGMIEGGGPLNSQLFIIPKLVLRDSC